jgi:predicted Zn-dependent peptidase
LSDILINPTFPEKELEKEKDVVIDEINSYLDNPSDEIFDEFEKLLFANHSIGGYILGKPNCIMKFNKNRIRKFIKRCYNTDEIVICSVGKIEFLKLIEITGKYFSGIKPNRRKWKRSKFKDYKPFGKTVFKNTHQTHCLIGNVAYKNKDKRRTSLIMLNNILGGPGMNSRLSMNIREKYGFCYNIESNYTSFTDTGLFGIYMGADNKNIEKTILLVHKELGKLRDISMGVLQLQRAKKQLIGQIAISYEQNLNEMLSMAKSFLVFNKVVSLEEVNKHIEGITSQNLIETANHIFDNKKLSTLIFKSDK